LARTCLNHGSRRTWRTGRSPCADS
jgi:hypothetical protein